MRRSMLSIPFRTMMGLEPNIPMGIVSFMPRRSCSPFVSPKVHVPSQGGGLFMILMRIFGGERASEQAVVFLVIYPKGG